MGGVDGWTTADSLSEPADIPEKVVIARSSRSGNERMRSITREGGRAMKVTRRDLMTGENPWNRTRGVGSVNNPRLSNAKRATREKPLIQPPASASTFVTTSGQQIDRILT